MLRRLFAKRSVPRDELTARIARVADEATEDHYDGFWFGRDAARETPTGAELLDGTPDELVELVLRCFAIAAHADRYGGFGDRSISLAAIGLASSALRRKLPWTEAQFDQLLADLALLRGFGFRPLNTEDHPVVPLVGAIERHYGERAPEGLHKGLARVAKLLDDDYAEHAKVIKRIRALTGDAGADALPKSKDPWTQALREASRTPLAGDVLTLAAGATAAKPTKSFLAERDALYERHGRAEVGEVAAQLLDAAAATKGAEGEGVPSPVGDVLRGLAWIAGGAGGEDAARALSAMALAGYKKVRWHGPLCPKAANAALTALAEHPEGAAELGRLRAQLKGASAVRAVEAAIAKASERTGVAPDEFEERAVPDFGLPREVALGEHVAELTFDGLRFRTSAGRTLKTVPAAVKADHAEELAELKRTAKDVKTMAAAQKIRLERLLMANREWSYDVWRARYADHGLVGQLARRLIWTFDGRPATGELVSVDGAPVEPGPVRLWHPVEAEPDDVGAWRRFLEEHEITQPFKQAHREVYVVTAAERETDFYSNRFAAHILRQHQMAALARERGWRYALQGGWDSGDSKATLELPEHELTVEFWVEPPHGSDDFNEMGVANHVISDQVRYLGAESLEAIDPRVFSETMRDVDLFVGVTSIGNDPTWADQGERNYREYWHDYAFGDLTEQAEVRRDLLSRLLAEARDPRRGRARWEVPARRGLAAHVQDPSRVGEHPHGAQRRVPVHRPGPRPQGLQVFLPFEGDQVLSLILSEAFLLAADEKITDRTILSQIRRRAGGPPRR